MAKQHDASISLHEVVPLNFSDNCPSSGHCLDCLKAKCGFCSVKDAMSNPINGACVPFNGSSYHAAYGRCSVSDHQTTWSYAACPYKHAWLAIVALLLYIAAFAPGMGPMPWTINSDIYPLWARRTGNAFATATNWTFNLIISMTFLSLTLHCSGSPVMERSGFTEESHFAAGCFSLFMYQKPKANLWRNLNTYLVPSVNFLKNSRTIHTKQNSNQDYAAGRRVLGQMLRSPHINC